MYAHMRVSRARSNLRVQTELYLLRQQANCLLRHKYDNPSANNMSLRRRYTLSNRIVY